ncbi:MAG: bifunctional oligoribonuclease/PAP phosphatase NrnA [Defluviitaleaceae bacterium]|nr:bifunctional oligoribonuclease/PAP phosphatase NrnA [Defluviitaleaceae bacterium]
MAMVPKEITNTILSAHDIVISGHINGDGDSIGSCFAMAHALKSMGKNPMVLLEDYPSKYTILPGFDFVNKSKNLKPDLFIALDCGEESRLGKAVNLFRNSPNIVIDHHVNEGYGDHNFINTNASSTCEIVYEVLMALGVEIDANIAFCLYAGIVTDTGGFRFKSTSPKTMEITGQLLKQDIPFAFIYERLIYQQTLHQFKGFLSIIGDFTIVPDINLVYTIATLEKMRELGITRGDLDGVVTMFKRIKEMDVAVFAYERENGTTKVSLRSDTINVNEIAQHFGGGGHKYASGIDMDSSPKQSIEQIVEWIRQNIGTN